MMSLLMMAKEAREYIESFAWAPPIRELSLARGLGGVFALFLVEFSRPINESDDFLWVVVGDLPSAYLVVGPSDSPLQAMKRYLILMEQWAQAIKRGDSIGECFPVSAAPTVENADALLLRIAVMRAEVIPEVFR
jgi:hypothetical protein